MFYNEYISLKISKCIYFLKRTYSVLENVFNVYSWKKLYFASPLKLYIVAVYQIRGKNETAETS